MAPRDHSGGGSADPTEARLPPTLLLWRLTFQRRRGGLPGGVASSCCCLFTVQVVAWLVARGHDLRSQGSCGRGSAPCDRRSDL